MVRSTRATRRVAAPADQVYGAFLDPAAFAAWLPPQGMRAQAHVFEPRVGGRIRMSLTYEEPAAGHKGKSSEDTDTFAGRFEELVPGRRVVHLVEFESDDPRMAGTMRVAWDLAPADERGTDVTCTCEGIPPGISLEDNEAGTVSTLEKLAALFARER